MPSNYNPWLGGGSTFVPSTPGYVQTHHTTISTTINPINFKNDTGISFHEGNLTIRVTDSAMIAMALAKTIIDTDDELKRLFFINLAEISEASKGNRELSKETNDYTNKDDLLKTLFSQLPPSEQIIYKLREEGNNK
jgi:hypothetical protein